MKYRAGLKKNYFADYGRMGTAVPLNYCFHGDKVEIGPYCLSHDYLCPMTIWGLIKRSHCLCDWSKKVREERLTLWDGLVYLRIYGQFAHCSVDCKYSQYLKQSDSGSVCCFSLIVWPALGWRSLNTSTGHIKHTNSHDRGNPLILSLGFYYFLRECALSFVNARANARERVRAHTLRADKFFESPGAPACSHAHWSIRLACVL